MGVALILSACSKPAAPEPAPAATPKVAAATLRPAQCDEVPQTRREGRDYGNAPLVVPKAYGKFLTPGETQLGVLVQDGTTMCVDLEGITDGTDWTLSPDERFLAFAHSGYETAGYMVIDRAGAGSAIETGAKPLGSPSGKYLAAAQVSEAAMGSLEGIGVWEVEAKATKPRGYFEPPTRGDDWKVERWASDTCAVVTMKPFIADQDPKPVAYDLRLKAGKWQLLPLAPGEGPCA